MYFALVTGHFQLPQFSRTILNPAHPEVGNGAISVWMLDHPDIYQAATLGVTVEHLGATMWTNNPVTGQYMPTGGSEWGTTYTMQRDVISLVNAEQDAWHSPLRVGPSEDSPAMSADRGPRQLAATAGRGAAPG
jgi:hypothetical protein